MKKVLAHYSPLKIVLPIAVTWAVGVGVFYLTIWFDNGHLLKYAEEPSRRYWIPLLFFIWIGGAVSLASAIVLLKRLLFDNSVALWIERNKLVFFHRWAFSVKCEDIQDATESERNQTKIILRMRRGPEREIPTSALAEPTETVLSRLRAALYQQA